MQSRRALAFDREVPQEHPHRREKLLRPSGVGVIPALLLNETTKLLSRKAAWVIPQTIQEIHQMEFISLQRGFSHPAVLTHPGQELLKQGRPSLHRIYHHARQNADASQVFDKPLRPSHDKRTPAALWSRASALR
jgi:hypothetical protein